MSCVIATSDRPEDIWGIRNTIYEWFVGLVVQRFGSDARLAEWLKQSEYVHALGLDSMRGQDPALARRVSDALLVVASEVARGRHLLVDHYGRPWPQLQKDTERAFDDLVQLLTRFRQALDQP